MTSSAEEWLERYPLDKTFVHAVLAASEDALDILFSRHVKYGPKNISGAPGGALNGIAVRAYDKIARLANLSSGARARDAADDRHW